STEAMGGREERVPHPRRRPEQPQLAPACQLLRELCVPDLLGGAELAWWWQQVDAHRRLPPDTSSSSRARCREVSPFGRFRLDFGTSRVRSHASQASSSASRIATGQY